MMLGKNASGDELMKRTQLANSLMYLTRGQPVVYYGDEQGFMGAGGDKDARQDMFATKTDQYAGEPVLGGAPGSRDRYDTNAPLYQQISGLARLRAAHPALTDGAQVHRYASDGAGVYAFSRVDRASGTEYLIVANNAAETKSAAFSTFSAKARFQPVHGATEGLSSGKDSRVTVSVPPLSVQVFKATSRFAKRSSAPTAYLTSPQPGAVVGGRAEIGAAITENTFAQTTFLYRPVGTAEWTKIGTDDSAPYRVFHDVSGMADGTLLEYRALVKDSSGNVSATSSYGVVGKPAAGGGDAGGGVGPVVQPDAVSVPGDHNSEMGCSGDWQPDCAQAQLTLDAKDQIWKGTHSLTAGATHAYKAAVNKSWDENYGAKGVPNGGNIEYTAPGAPVTFYYDHATHWVTSDAQGPVITAPGSFQSELGCPGTGAPTACARGCRTPTATAPTRGQVTRSPLAPTSSRSPMA